MAYATAVLEVVSLIPGFDQILYNLNIFASEFICFLYTICTYKLFTIKVSVYLQALLDLGLAGVVL